MSNNDGGADSDDGETMAMMIKKKNQDQTVALENK